MRSIFFLCFYYISLCIGDNYLHNPRGCNNRLNEKSANRQNANRLCDTQNNNRGGYNVADMNKNAGFTRYGTDQEMYDYSDDTWEGNDAFQFEEVYVAGSIMDITWTSQHGCGNPKNNCNFVWQWTCDTHDNDDDGAVNSDNEIAGMYYPKDGQRIQLKNGLNTNTPQDPNNIADVDNTYNTNNNNNVGRHESEEFYAFAKQRDRNDNYFTADQKVGNKQINTRQNPNGGRSGLEVPEERDYYPWDWPTPWKTAVIFHNNVTECEEKMLPFDQANSPKYQCVPNANVNWNNVDADKIKVTTEDDCVDADYSWRTYQHPNGVPQPLCEPNTWSQVNNLGNVDGTIEGGLPRSYEWTLPTVAGLKAAGCFEYTDTSGLQEPYFRLAARMRYNMTTGDYDPYGTDKDCNQNNQNQIQSPVQQNPTVDVNVLMQGLRLAINTAQTGRTFQDRSHVFRIMTPVAALQNKVIRNQNVQGKRGNIVQTFPAVEYDFWPRKQLLQVGECMSIGWVGSNTHNNGNPAGDGQAGDAGEGQGGTDRHNLIEVLSKDRTYPVPLDKPQFANDFFTKATCYRTYDGEEMSSGTAISEKDVQMYLMSNGFYTSYNKAGDARSFQTLAQNQAGQLDELLNDTPASLRSITCCAEEPGEWTFTNTRNNNFSNRDQKLVVTVE